TPRPPVEGWAGRLFDALAGFDLPFNQAPSLHIVLLLILWDFYRRRLHGPRKGALHIWSALVGISVLTTYQHHFIDVPTGLLAGALCMWLWPLDGRRPLWQWTASPARRRLAFMYGSSALALALLAGMGRAWWWLHWPAASLALVALCSTRARRIPEACRWATQRGLAPAVFAVPRRSLAQRPVLDLRLGRKRCAR